MRIVFQGSATPAQLGKAISEILSNTLEKVEVKGKRQPLQNAVVEFNLNLQGYETPQLITVEDGTKILTIHTGIENGELTEYKEVDRKELLDKFNEMVENGTKELEELAKEETKDVPTETA
jgi:hypothetical protein